MMSGGTNRLLGLALALVLLVAVVIVLLSVLTDFSLTDNLDRGERRVGFLTEHTPRALVSHFAGLADALGGDYELTEVSLGVPGSLDSLDVLVVLGSGHLADAMLFEIDQFLMRGGRAAFLLDGADVSDDLLTATVARGNLFAFVESYGANVNPDLVVDPANGSTAYTTGVTPMPHAFWPRGVPEPSRRGGVRVPARRDLVFTWTSSISLSDRLPESAEASVLVRSPEGSWTIIAFADLAPGEAPDRQPPGEHGTLAPSGDDLPLAVAIEGVLASAFEGMLVIVERDDGSVEFTDPPGRLDSGAPTRVVVMGCSRMFEDRVLERVPSNLEFLVNAIDWLAAR